MIRERMGRLLLEAGMLSDVQLDAGLQYQRAHGGHLGSVLVELGILSESHLLEFLSQKYGVPVLDGFPADLDPSLSHIVPSDIAVTRCVVPVHRIESRLTVAMVDPSDVSLIDELTFQTGLHMVPVVASAATIRHRIGHVYGQDVFTRCAPSRLSAHDLSKCSLLAVDSNTEETGELASSASSFLLNPREFEGLLKKASASLPGTDTLSEHESSGSDAAPIVEFVDRLLRPAIREGVSDIHLEPFERSVRVRFRLDGMLHSVMTYPLGIRNAMISRIKILSHLNIAERRLPQDGRFTYKNEQKGRMDIRVSILPCFHGEKVVLRILDRSGLALDLSKLGFESSDLSTFLRALDQPEGMILVTGPTGSGKTTTLYSALNLLNTPDVNIVTVEDPVEYQFIGMNQVQIREDIGLGFAEVLRAVLRQDPDIVMVGEIRDQSTAQIAVKAALTGHRVLSTVHTNDAVRTVTRLLDMGVDPYLVASSVSLILAQRLVRKICAYCTEPDSHSVSQLMSVGFAPEEASSITLMKGRGCSRCHATGYHGRVAIFEVLCLSDALQELIFKRASPEELTRVATESGFLSLRRNGLQKVQAGMTTIQEIVKATSRGSMETSGK